MLTLQTTIFLLLFVNKIVQSLVGVDLSRYITKDEWASILKSVDYKDTSFAIVRILYPNGNIDQNSVSTIKGAWENDIHNISVYMYPCLNSTGFTNKFKIICPSPKNQFGKITSYLASSDISFYATFQPTSSPSLFPTQSPSLWPTIQPTNSSQFYLPPSSQPSSQPSRHPTSQPTFRPSIPTSQPTSRPSLEPYATPTSQPTKLPIGSPTGSPTHCPSSQPTLKPFSLPSSQPSSIPSNQPTITPTTIPSSQPSTQPVSLPTSIPSNINGTWTRSPVTPTGQPPSQASFQPSSQPSRSPSSQPSNHPSNQPSRQPSNQPTTTPSTSPTSTPSFKSVNTTTSVQLQILFINIEDNIPFFYFSNNVTANIDYLLKMENIAKKLGIAIGIYTTYYDWLNIMGDTHQFQHLPLWTPKYDQINNMKFFRSFGGWTNVYIKQTMGGSSYARRIGENRICTNYIANSSFTQEVLAFY